MCFVGFRYVLVGTLEMYCTRFEHLSSSPGAKVKREASEIENNYSATTVGYYRGVSGVVAS